MTEQPRMTDKANLIVKNHMLASILAGLVPLPLLDLALLSGIQLKMLHGLSKVYGVEFSRNLGKAVIAALLGGGISASLASNLGQAIRVTSLTKGVPFYGAVAGGVAIAVLGGASTYAVGKVFIYHFETGGTLLDFDPEKLSGYYAAQLERGRGQATAAYVNRKP